MPAVHIRELASGVRRIGLFVTKPLLAYKADQSDVGGFREVLGFGR